MPRIDIANEKHSASAHPTGTDDLWVFGYGSLMWNPGISYQETTIARLHGLHRAFCVWSWTSRGTPDNPGLVLGLDLGGSCVGRVFRVGAKHKARAADYLIARENNTPVYHAETRKVQLESGQTVSALLFRADRASPQYAGKVDLFVAATVVRGASGDDGANSAYVTETLAHLDDCSIPDVTLRSLAALL